MLAVVPSGLDTFTNTVKSLVFLKNILIRLYGISMYLCIHKFVPPFPPSTWFINIHVI